MIDLRQGDCYEIIKTIPDNSVNCIYVDVPYKYECGSHGSSDLSKRIYKYQKQQLQELNIYDGFDYKILDEFIRVSKNVNIYIWCSRLQIVDILNYFVSKGYKYNILCWCKTNPTPATNNSWLPDIEYCLYFRDSKTKLNNGYHLKHKYYVSAINQKDKKLWKHPTIKPLELVKQHLQHTTQENDIVLDCFMGSGTTGVACKELNRNFIGIEIDNTYFDIAKQRIEGTKEKFEQLSLV
jgi:DNA modification methylase